QAAGMAQPCGSGRLALGPRRRLPFAGDDLQRDVEARPLVAGEPDRARPAAPEGPNRPVATEDGLALLESERAGHRCTQVGGSGRISSREPSPVPGCSPAPDNFSGGRVTVWPDRVTA